MDQRNHNIQPDAQSLQSVTSLNLESKVRAHNQHHITRQDTCTGDHSSKSGERNNLHQKYINKPHSNK